MERRKFIQSTAAAGALAGIGSLGLLSFTAAKKPKHITILHTNDVHSHIEPFDNGHAQYPGMGGAARRYTLINQIRQENPHTLLLDAGDIFQGTPYFNYYGGELEFKLMSKMRYDAATIGNHDFDNGIDGLLAQLPHAKFPFINANYNFDNTVLEGRIKPYQVFVRDGIKIGVFGVGIELKGLVAKKHYKETEYHNPIDTAKTIVKQLREEEKCELVICLSHLGYEYRDDKVSDQKLAAATKDIDLIIGGHTHTFLPKPTVALNAIGEKVLINQVGWAGVNIGRIDFYLDSSGKKNGGGAAIIV
ncbi:metallophosphatase [Salinimicrobium sp. MT39]|uniref:Metallophosphatase n=1 Tax=Salinimicrobium profundisediminis TaxID=2994553 RepID=A0A9X3I043_9FLAO|nr:metallophosphatase [Salinimicrobium profundisediminis]MCX2837620.1 metallophosphatase [Salinimicrobium profundisediminis]